MIEGGETKDLLERIAVASEIMTRLLVRQVSVDMSQKDAILLLDEIGCSPGDIAKYLGAPTSSIYPTLSRARKNQKGEK